jgi:hypothetical protein
MQTGYLSTTKLLKIAHEATDGNIAEAIEVLRPMQQDHVEAYSAIRVLRMKMRKHPGATTFSFGHHAFVTVA